MDGYVYWYSVHSLNPTDPQKIAKNITDDNNQMLELHKQSGKTLNVYNQRN